MIALAIKLIVIGILLWAEERYLPVDPQIKKLIRWVVIICVGVWLLYVFGVLPAEDIPIPKLRG